MKQGEGGAYRLPVFFSFFASFFSAFFLSAERPCGDSRMKVPLDDGASRFVSADGAAGAQ